MRYFYLLVCFSFCIFLPTRSVSSVLANPGPAVQITQDEIHIRWQTPNVTWQSVDDASVVAELPGYTAQKQPGTPIVPFSSVLVALPNGISPLVEATYATPIPVSLSQPIGIAPNPQGVVVDQKGDVISGGYMAATLSDDFLSVPFTFEEVGTMRGTRLARVSFYPIQVHTLTQVSLISSLEVVLTFDNWQTHGQSGQKNSSDPLSESLAGLVINPQHISPHAAQQLSSTSQSAVAGSIAIEVEQSGITAVTRSDLVDAGLSLGGVSPAKLQLWQNGVKIPMEWDGDGDAHFETGERFLFFADPAFSRWANHDTYILTVGSGNGTRIGGVTTSIGGLANGRRYATAVLEENTIYSPNCYCGKLPLGRDGDRWMWDDLRQPGRPSNSYSFTLLPVDSSQPAELTTWFIGFTSVNNETPDHRVDIDMNGTALGTVYWDARTAVTETLTVPPAVLQTSNDLALELPGIPGVPIDGVWFDAAQVRYVLGSGVVGTAVQFEGEASNRKYTTILTNGSGVRVFDVTNPAKPVKLSGVAVSGSAVTFGDTASGVRRYAVSNENGILSPSRIRLTKGLLTEGTGNVDYLIISHPNFIPALAPLIAWRESRGLTVAVEDVLAIYDVYGNGRPSPDAIRAYLNQMYTTALPTYVLLVGDATIDPKQYRSSSSETYVLPYLAEIDPWIGEVPTDNRYVTVDGNDIIPDMLLGRLPVNTAVETTTVVSKIINYEKTPAVGIWNRTLSFVADNQDPAGDFAHHSNDLIDGHISSPYMTRRIYYEPDIETVEQVVTEIRQMWNAGVGMVFYTGHSSTHQWGAERYLHLDDVSTLVNGPRLPIVLQMTCLTGSFHRPDFETLDEALLRHPNGGAVAIWGSTGLGVATGHEQLSSGYLDSILGSDPTIGPAVLAGKLNVMLNAPTSDEIVDSYTLFGDPAMQFNNDFESGFSHYLPIIVR